MLDGRRLLMVHAHPDDESISTGGLLIRCAEAGIDTCLVCCTDGRYGPVSPELGVKVTPDELAEIRRKELASAGAILGVSQMRWLGHHDSDMTGSSRNNLPRAFWAQPVDTLVAELVRVVREFRPHGVVTYDPYGSTGHPDHIQAHRVTLLALEAADEARAFPEAGAPWHVQSMWYPVYPVSALETFIKAELHAGRPHPFDGKPIEEINYGRPDDIVTHRVVIREVYQRKQAALLSHRSQVGSHYPALYKSALARREHEHYRLARGGLGFDDVLAPVA